VSSDFSTKNVKIKKAAPAQTKATNSSTPGSSPGGRSMPFEKGKPLGFP
jgi:hypothetical protein